jgi:hypothetical protein
MAGPLSVSIGQRRHPRRRRDHLSALSLIFLRAALPTFSWRFPVLGSGLPGQRAATAETTGKKTYYYFLPAALRGS